MKHSKMISRRSFLQAAVYSTAALSALALTGCGASTSGSSAAAGTSSAAASGDVYKVGIVNYYIFASIIDFGPKAYWLQFLCITVLLTFLLLLFGEIMPKVYSRQNPLQKMGHRVVLTSLSGRDFNK